MNLTITEQMVAEGVNKAIEVHNAINKVIGSMEEKMDKEAEENALEDLTDTDDEKVDEIANQEQKWGEERLSNNE